MTTIDVPDELAASFSGELLAATHPGTTKPGVSTTD